MEIDTSDLICRLIGYLDGGMDSPTFVMPVFIDLDTDQHVIQVTGPDDKIVGFEPISTGYQTIATSGQVIRRVGDDALYSIRVDGRPILFQDRANFDATMLTYLDSGLFDKFPAFGLTVAKMLNSRDKVGDFKHQLFNEISDSALKTKKYFLENNIIREELESIMPSDYRSIVRKMKIDIQKSRILISVPDNTDGQARQELGKKVTDLYRKFTKSTSVDLSFDHSARQLDEIAAELTTIKSGKFEFDPEMFDLPNHWQNISMRESLIVVPEAARYYYRVRRNASWAVSHLTSTKLPFEPLSMPTARKIVELETVSTISAMLFRVWTFGDVYEARLSSQFKLHVCCYHIKIEMFDTTAAAAVREFLFSSQGAYGVDFLMPISMVTFMVNHEIIKKSDALEIFEFRRSGRFVPYFIIKTVREKWLDYCADFDRGLDVELALEISNQSSGEYLL
ncbi:hypothetical protein ACLBXO_05305 [Methylobacterium sp. C33D]